MDSLGRTQVARLQSSSGQVTNNTEESSSYAEFLNLYSILSPSTSAESSIWRNANSITGIAPQLPQTSHASEPDAMADQILHNVFGADSNECRELIHQATNASPHLFPGPDSFTSVEGSLSSSSTGSVPVNTATAEDQDNRTRNDSSSDPSDVTSIDYLLQTPVATNDVQTNSNSVAKTVTKPQRKGTSRQPDKPSNQRPRASSSNRKSTKSLQNPIKQPFLDYVRDLNESSTQSFLENSTAANEMRPEVNAATDCQASGSVPSLEKIKQVEEELRQKMQQLSVLENENADLKLQQSLYEHLVSCRSFHLTILSKDMKTNPNALPLLGHFSNCLPRNSSGLGIHSLLGECFSPQRLLLELDNGEPFSPVSVPVFIRQWKYYMAEISVCVIALEANMNDKEAAERLSDLCDKGTFLCRRMALGSPQALVKVMCMNLETGEEDQIAPPEHWRTVVKAVNFSADQETRMIRLYELYKKMMVNIVAERRVLQEELEKGVQQTMHIKQLLHARGLHPDSAMFVRLNKNFSREKCAHDILKVQFFGKLISVLQFAKLAVHAYPYYPDVTALISAVADLKKQ